MRRRNASAQITLEEAYTMTRRDLPGWSDDRLRAFVRSVEAGKTDGDYGWHGVPADYLPLFLLREELARRGWPALRLGRMVPKYDPSETYEQRERKILARWSDDRFRRLVVAVEAGHHNDVEGWEHGPSLAGVFDLRFITDEAARRGWPPVQISAPVRRPRSP